ncbi:subtilisin-like protein [Rhizopogon vinicolor AM-OR11-026]|uniref:Subtilisin-like protein n=1 Tax=Rhizopogon vinicolor AM-OR11-026 TaxID=1314800 RepID=A0A1B7MI10_9AGAM|nr:subtilisin-like protein [Rhizopogon vinicolor AM-OR11-026]
MRSFLLPVLSFTLGLAAASVIADPIISPWKLHEKRTHIPVGWTRARKHEPSASIPLRFALSQSNIQDIETLLYDVSHPDSPNYGKHWSPGQIAAKFTPSTESVETVHAWLIESGVEPHRVKLSPTKGWLEVTSTVEEAESLLNAEYHVYDHETGTKHVACDSYQLPEHVVPHVDFVTPTIHFDAKLRKRDKFTRMPVGQPGRSGPKTGGGQVELEDISDQIENCDKQITLVCLKTLYGLWYEPVAADKNSFGIVEFTPQSYLQPDLDMFAKNFSTGLEGISPTLASIDGGVVQTLHQNSGYNLEASLDLEYGMTLVTKSQNVTLYQVGDIIQGGSNGNFLDALDGTYCTYEGGDDPIKDSIYPDDAEGGYKNKDCGTVKPTNIISTSYSYNEADLSAPYAIRQCNEYAKLGLMGVTLLFNSGDFGVAGEGGACLNANGSQSTDGKIFNPTFPGTCPYVTSIGATQVSPGQSVSDPENACEQIIYSSGGFSNYFGIPDYQKAAGKSPIGFINPTIYSTGFAGSFNDVTNGTNPGCGTLGFNATQGWDPVTGLGTPNFPSLLAKWLAL